MYRKNFEKSLRNRKNKKGMNSQLWVCRLHKQDI